MEDDALKNKASLPFYEACHLLGARFKYMASKLANAPGCLQKCVILLRDRHRLKHFLPLLQGWQK